MESYLLVVSEPFCSDAVSSVDSTCVTAVEGARKYDNLQSPEATLESGHSGEFSLRSGKYCCSSSNTCCILVRAWSFLLLGTFFSLRSKLNKKNGSLDPHSVGECISNFSVSISISFLTSAFVFIFLLGGTWNLLRGLVEGVDISSGNSHVVAVEFFTSSFSCPSDTESLSSSSWYSHCSCWLFFEFRQVVECYQKRCYYWPHPWRISSCWSKPTLVCLLCPRRHQIDLCYYCVLSAVFGRCPVGLSTLNLMFIGPCIIVIVEEWKTNLMSLAFLFHFLCAQHVSDINISIIRGLRLCCWITTSVVFFSVRCVLEVWCGWF